MNNEILQKFQNYCLVFDIVRIVDPLKKKVILSNKEDDMDDNDRACFELWNKNKVCVNCTSFRAYNERKTFMKTEYLGKKCIGLCRCQLKLKKNYSFSSLLKTLQKKNS